MFNKSSNKRTKAVRHEHLRQAGLSGLICVFVVAINVFVMEVSVAASCAVSSNDLGGTVFRDYDNNGTNGVASGVDAPFYDDANPVIVSAYDNSNTLVMSATIDTDGTYVLTDIFSAYNEVRLEFSGFPNYVKSGYSNANGTSVQFHSTGSCSADLAVHYAGDYCQSEPDIVVSKFLNGSGVAGTDPGLISFPFIASGRTSGFRTTDGVTGDVGSAYGLAYQAEAQILFVGSFLKRHTGFSRGPGHVMLFDYSVTPASFIGSFDLRGVNGIELGSVCRRSSTDNDVNEDCDPFATGLSGDYILPVSKGGRTIDLDAYGKVGSMSFGDIDLNRESSDLWLVNLYNDWDAVPTTGTADHRGLIKVDVSDRALLPTDGSAVSAGLVETFALSGMVVTLPDGSTSTFDGLCDPLTVGIMRPWALKIHHGKGYLGAVCDASVSEDANDLRAVVFEFDPASAAPSLTEVLAFDLDYTREHAGVYGASRVSAAWKYWASEWINREQHQPILSDIEFNKSGDMVIGLRDRVADQQGMGRLMARSNTNTTINLWGAGDILHACYVNGRYVLEQGNSGTVCASSDPGTSTDSAKSVSKKDGPGNAGEYYWADHYISGKGEGHNEVSLGSLALLQRSDQVLNLIYDPQLVNSQGILWFDTTNGQRMQRYEIVPNTESGHFGKSNGLGDVELLCAAAPLKIGNYVWLDKNGDGIQGPSEAGISGVTVKLTDSNGVFSEMVTDSQGEYYFAVQPDSAYTLTIDMSQSAIQSVADTTYTLTAANVDSGTSLSDRIGSNATEAGGLAVINLTTGKAGENDYHFDIGFTAKVDLSLTKTVDNTTPKRGDTVTYTLTVTNSSVNEATEVKAQDILPAEVTYVSHSGGTYDKGTGIWDVGSVTASGGTQVLTITVKVN